MSTLVEASFLYLLAQLRDGAADADALPDTVARNRSLRDVFGAVAGLSGGAYLNLVDGDQAVDADLLGGGDRGEVEFGLDAHLEWIVIETDQEARDAAFDAGMAALRDIILPLRSGVNDLWDDLEVAAIERANLATGGVPGVKAARITLRMMLTASSLFG